MIIKRVSYYLCCDTNIIGRLTQLEIDALCCLLTPKHRHLVLNWYAVDEFRHGNIYSVNTRWKKLETLKSNLNDRLIILVSNSKDLKNKHCVTDFAMPKIDSDKQFTYTRIAILQAMNSQRNSLYKRFEDILYNQKESEDAKFSAKRKLRQPKGKIGEKQLREEEFLLNEFFNNPVACLFEHFIDTLKDFCDINQVRLSDVIANPARYALIIIASCFYQRLNLIFRIEKIRNRYSFFEAYNTEIANFYIAKKNDTFDSEIAISYALSDTFVTMDEGLRIVSSQIFDSFSRFSGVLTAEVWDLEKFQIYLKKRLENS